jgi:hypothetical protein
MSYVVGTDVGRVRELVGDTDVDNEIFPDIYYEDLLTRKSARFAAIAALRRMRAEPASLIRKYVGFGPVTVSDMAGLIRLLDTEIEDLLASKEIVEATGDDSCTPQADQTSIGMATDEEGWHKVSDISEYLDS